MKTLVERIDEYVDEAAQGKATVAVRYYAYNRSHGKDPSKSTAGRWAFIVEDKKLVKALAKHDLIDSTHEDTVFVKGQLKLKEAEKAITAAIRDVAKPTAYVTIEVGP